MYHTAAQTNVQVEHKNAIKSMSLKNNKVLI